jgi:UDP-N-acetylglucosamine transferase subunit ALG13
MIFVTAGTNEQAFDRLIRCARALPGPEPLFVQRGSSIEPPGRGRWVDFLDWDEMRGAMTEARVVVAHAGVGSILLANRCGKRPVVMPRRGDLGEAVDDHQVALARRLASLELVTVAEDAGALAQAVAEAPPQLGFSAQGGVGGLADELRASLLRLAGRSA